MRCFSIRESAGGLRKDEVGMFEFLHCSGTAVSFIPVFFEGYLDPAQPNLQYTHTRTHARTHARTHTHTHTHV